ncbi:MAG: divalent-cation tolerance protein CutA [Gemmatimonadetes bacterium]|nr:divalent-cation tolerance protein CutA [Gemmatimonadota bacterium]
MSEALTNAHEVANAQEVVLVLTTVPDRETGERLAGTLVDERRVACGNLVDGVTSIYRWQGGVENERELLLLLKTRRELVPGLFERVAQLHPYDVPELVALPVDAVSNAYSRWVRDETTEVSA